MEADRLRDFAHGHLSLKGGFPFRALGIAARLKAVGAHNDGWNRTVGGGENLFIHMLIAKSYSGLECFGVDFKTKIANRGGVSGHARLASAFEPGRRAGNFQKRNIRVYVETDLARLAFVTGLGAELATREAANRRRDCNRDQHPGAHLAPVSPVKPREAKPLTRFHDHS